MDYSCFLTINAGLLLSGGGARPNPVPDTGGDFDHSDFFQVCVPFC
jgi:hypothetical protein